MRSVILVHGLWMPGLAMSPMAGRLSRAGYHCHLFDYAGRERPLAVNAGRLAQYARSVGPAHFVGHSLGGLVVLEALNANPALAVERVALLGTPARGNCAARRLQRLGWGRWFLGATQPLWSEGRAMRWTRPEPLGVIAGTLPLGLGRLFGALPGANDGVVRLEETEVEGMRERVVLRVGHSAMLLSARVAAQVAAFLRDARFSHSA